MISISKKIETA